MEIRTGRELAGLAVVTLSGGERLGRIEDVVFHAATGKVAGFLVDRGGMFSKPKYLPAAQVNSIGPDAVTVTEAGSLLDTAPEPLAPADTAAKTIAGRPVMSEAGTVLGKVADVEVDTQALAVVSLVLSTGLLDNALHGRPSLPIPLVQAIGADSVIASNTYDPKTPTEPS